MEKEMDKQMKIKFLMFENDKNVCWLDASIALVAHNKTFKKIVENSSESQISKIISAYDEATTTFNNSDSEHNMVRTQKILLAIQSNTLKYLKQFLKFKPGEPDSAFCALLNLIYQDKSEIKEYLNVSWIWRKQCSSCGVNSKSATCLKPIITLSKVDTFHPECPSSIYVCSCKSEQEMKLIYKELPPCLIFHFEKGVSTGTNFPVNFSIKGREYQLTGIIILEKCSDPSLNHFVTWIRNPVFNIWLECNDLNTGFATFTPIKPEFDLKDVYIAVFEAFDNLDRINNDDDELSIDEEQDVENSNVELIDLSDEEGDTEKVDSCAKSCNISNQNVSECDLKFTTLDKHEIESKDFNSQHEAIDEFTESKEFKAESADYKENKVSKDPLINKDKTFSNPLVSSKTSTVENLEMHNEEKTKDNEEECKDKDNEEECNSQIMSVSSLSLLNDISPIEHETKAESDNFHYQNKSFDDLPKAKVNDNQKLELAVASNEKKKEKISSPSNSVIVAENITADNTSYKETFFEKTSTKNDSISVAVLENKADAKENETNRYDEKKLQLKMKQISLKIKENNCLSPNEEKRGKVEDSFINSNKRKKEITDSKCVSSDKEKNMVIMNDHCAGTSLDSNKASENIFQNSESTSTSKDFDSYKKKSKIPDNENVKEFEKNKGEASKQNGNAKASKQNGNAKARHSNRKALSKESREKLRRIIDFTVSRTYAAFFDGINQARENKLSQ